MGTDPQRPTTYDERGNPMKLDLKAEHTIYRHSSGARLTGVTTYLGVLAKPSLMNWYASEERKGVLAAMESGKPLPKGPFAERKRDKAADLGTITHARVEGFLKSDPLDPEGIPDDLYAASEHGYLRFLNWWSSEGMSVVESEKVMCFEDIGMAYGGTADIIAQDRTGRLTLVDLKTSKKSRYWPYAEIYAQVAAYAVAYENIEGTPIDRICIVRIGKEVDDDLQVVEVDPEQKRAGWGLFRAAYHAYEHKKELERMA